ncbi:MAG: hypothetical protein ACRECO_13060 [Xanthobacteraceae bacterium]
MTAMRAFRLTALLAGVVSFAASASTAEFRLEEVSLNAEGPLVELKPGTIAFSDRPGEGLIDATTGFITYEDWAKARPLHRQFLSLYPGYSEPNTNFIINGVRRRFRERLHMYVAEARFLLSRPPEAFDLAKFVTLPFVERLDPAIKHRPLAPTDEARPREPKALYNQHPSRRWCEGRPTVICIRSVYQLEGRLPVGIKLANKIREGARHISDKLEFDSELTLVSAAEVGELGLTKLTRFDTPSVGALEQSIYYVNQVMQFGKLLAVFQRHASDPKRTVVSVFTALAIESNVLGKRKEYGKVPVLRNMVPAQVLSGKSSFNTGKSLSAGLPVYARNQIRAIAAILDSQ